MTAGPIPGGDGHQVRPSLETQVASEVKELLREVPVGAEFPVSPSAEICGSLELFLPRLLRARHPEWVRESLDGIFVARARKTGVGSIELVGTCILISDQTVTPFVAELEASPTANSIERYRVLLGEPGGGPLGISGPGCNSRDAHLLLENLLNRLGDVSWSYTVGSGFDEQ